MARKPTGRPAGRPKKPTGAALPTKRPEGNQPAVIDWKKVDQYLEAGASGIQIAAKLDVYHETLYDCCVRDNNMSWTEYSHLKKLGGDADLHWLQMSSARRGNTQILLKLGELRLGQGEIKEKVSPFQTQIDHEHENMILKSRIAKLEAQINGNKPEAESEL